MDSRTKAVGRKRRRQRNSEAATSSKRLKSDNSDTDDTHSNYSDFSHDDESSDFGAADGYETQHNHQLRNRDTRSDQDSDNIFENFKGSKNQIAVQVGVHVSQVLHQGSRATTLSEADVILVAKLPKIPEAQDQDGDAASGEVLQTTKTSKNGQEKVSRNQVSQKLTAHCVAVLSPNLIGFATFIRSMIRLVLPYTSREFCYLLRYSSQQAAADALTKIATVPCAIGQSEIPLQGFGPEILRLPSVEGKLLATCPDAKQFRQELLEIVLTEKSERNLLGVNTNRTSSAAIDAQRDGESKEDGEKEPLGAENDRLAVEQDEQFVKRSATDSDIHEDEMHDIVIVDGTTSPNIDPTAAASGVRLRDLPEEERKLQARYWGITDDHDLAHCSICSQPGHMPPTCLSRTCKYCAATDAHFSYNCPGRIKCPKCRERGHDITTCQSKLARTEADGYDCDFCHGSHKEDDCSWIWRSFDPAQIAPEKLIKVKSLTMFCYECGSDKHWGDDCLGVSKSKAKTSTNNVFSAKFANQFLEHPLAASTQRAKQFSIRGRAQKSRPGAEEEVEYLGDASNFVGKKINVKLPRRPQIQVNARPAQANGFKPINAYNRDRPPGRYENYRSVPPPHEQKNHSRHIDHTQNHQVRGYNDDRNGNRPSGGYGVSGWTNGQQRAIDVARNHHVNADDDDRTGSETHSRYGASGWTRGAGRG